MRPLLASSVGFIVGWCALSAAAQEVSWRPASTPAVPGVRLGQPVAPDGSGQPVASPAYAVASAPRSVPVASLGQPITQTTSTSWTANAPGLAPVPPPDAFNCAPVAGGPVLPPLGGGSTGANLFGQEWLGATSSSTRKTLESDHAFDSFVSPVSNPFLFEDPRSLTEVRPIFIFQSAPTGNYLFRGGDSEFLGVQARIAVTERLSFVINKLGAVWQQPDNGMGILGKDGGWSELWISPKYTFIRNESTNTVAAAGLQFQIPDGPNKVEQNTGSLSVVPYLSVAQGVAKTDYGSINFMNTTGYSASVDRERSDYFYSSFHVDFDLANLHKIFPLLELNWFQYTQSGKSRDLGFEGRDLFNFGSEGVAGTGTVTLAPGIRYKFNDNFQTGLALEFPLVSPRDLVDFRLTLDFILRY